MRSVRNRVSESFTIATGTTQLGMTVLGAIDQVHGVEGVTSLRLEHRRTLPEWEGQFDPYSRTISISSSARLPISTGVHEVGHVLDALFLVSAGGQGSLQVLHSLYASDHAALYGRGVLVDWFQEAMHSRPVSEFLAVRRAASFGSSDHELASYYVDRQEVWARSYEQFIAQNCRDTRFRSEFHEKRLHKIEIGGRRIRVYWTHREFAPIERAIKVLFRSLGWI